MEEELGLLVHTHTHTPANISQAWTGLAETETGIRSCYTTYRTYTP